MRLLDWLGRQGRRGRDHSRERSPRSRPALECLEPRTLLAATANELAFVNKAYTDLLHHPADQAALNYWGDVLDHGASYTQVALQIENSAEYRAVVVQDLYTALLHRPADPAGLNFFVTALTVGATREQVQSLLAGSAEYIHTRGGDTVNGFLDALYQDALGRPLDAPGQAFFGGLLAAGVGPAQVADVIFTSAEYRQDLVQNLFQQFLHRPASPGEVAGFVAGLQQGGRDEDVIATLLGTDEYAPGAYDSGSIVLSQSEVELLMGRASAATSSQDAIIAIVDRDGRPLGVRVEAGVSTNITGNVGNLTYAIDGALAEARTAAFFASGQAPLTSRTIQFISQTTITQREVESNPSIPDPNSIWRGPGFVAPVGLGGHFPPNVPNTPPVDLFAIEHTNRDTIANTGTGQTFTQDNPAGTVGRFNVPRQFVPAGAELTPPDSYGVISGLMPTAQPRGIGTLPGGIPIYKFGVLVGGIGIFFPGQSGTATEENSSLSATFDPTKPDRSLEAEYMAFAALGQPTAFGGIQPLNGITPFPTNIPLSTLLQGINLAGVTLDIFGPGGTQGLQNLLKYSQSLAPGTVSGVDAPVQPSGQTLRDGKPVPDGWLVTPHAGVGISAADVQQMITQGVNEANLVRAQIRLPNGVRTRMVFAVADSTGAILGLFRMPDATVFSIDVAVAKSRNMAYYDNPALIQAVDVVPGLPPGVAFTSRTVRFLAQPRYPEGVDNTPPAPFSIINDGGVDPRNGLQVGPRLPASAFQSVLGHDAFNPGTNFHDPFNLANQNGIVFFPGSSGVFKPVAGSPLPGIVGGLGVSGDGVNQDDQVTSVAIIGFSAPAPVEADQFVVAQARLPYYQFPRNPHE